jgi:hypothetical protein
MSESQISDIVLAKSKEEFSVDEKIVIDVKFSILGKLRDSFNEEEWTESYNNNDVSFKMKYGIKVQSGGGLRKHVVGDAVDSYRKASFFWTRNPKLVNPMKDKRVWVQVAKNFEPVIKLTEEEVKEELFDFDEKITFKASELGSGKHKISAEVYASWQKHNYIDAESLKKNSDKEIEIIIS